MFAAVPSGGKTGTAEFGENESEVGRAAYGWFASYAPIDKPQIAVAAVLYDGGHGNYAGRVVKAIYDQYFGIQQQDVAAGK
jgi:penicillin-binding protein 2